jgi:hypothetical protein
VRAALAKLDHLMQAMRGCLVTHARACTERMEEHDA